MIPLIFFISGLGAGVLACTPLFLLDLYIDIPMWFVYVYIIFLAVCTFLWLYWMNETL